jgi:hypothetical protein
MVVRINKLELTQPAIAEGWPQNEHTGPIRYHWPAGTNLFEVMILEQDESRRPLNGTFRQQQLRKLIPAAVEAVREMSDHIVVRLDGQMAKGELLPAVSRLAAGDELFRYAMSPVRRIDPHAGRVNAGIRALMTGRQLTALCGDHSLGLERSVRLRLFAVPEDLVGPLLDVDTVEDERWAEILPRTGFLLTTTPALTSLQILTPRLDANQIKSRLTQRLMRPVPRPLKT